MSKSKIIFDKFAKLFEQGLLTYKDLSSEIINILKSRRDEIIFRLKLIELKIQTIYLFVEKEIKLHFLN